MSTSTLAGQRHSCLPYVSGASVPIYLDTCFS